jgi:hypothetical protein
MNLLVKIQCQVRERKDSESAHVSGDVDDKKAS